MASQPLINSETFACILWFTTVLFAIPIASLWLHKVTGKQVVVRPNRAAKDTSTEDHLDTPCPSCKEQRYFKTSVLMMFNMEDEVKSGWLTRKYALLYNWSSF